MAFAVKAPPAISAMGNLSDSPAAKPAPIRIALRGFADAGQTAQITALFSHAGRWQQPWQLVEEARDAEFLLLAADTPEELAHWHRYEDRFSREHLIAYSERPLEEARWHLRRPSGMRGPSPLEFTLLLKEISQRLAVPAESGAHRHQAIAKAAKTHFDWRERLKILIVGSVDSGKTTAIATLTEGHALSTEAVPSDHTQLRKKSTTVAMDFGCIALNEDTQLHIYGAPGQRRFDFMSEILMRNALGLIILVSNETSHSLTELNYYLNTHREFLHHHQAVIGVTHNDVNPSPSLNEYASFVKARGESWPVLKVDARKRDDMMKLVHVLLASTLTHG
jgi:hypothetical protein